jgi:hypothetical protein
MFVSRKFVLLFLASLIGFTLGFRLSQSTLAAKSLVKEQQLAVVQHESTPVSHRAEGNTS